MRCIAPAPTPHHTKQRHRATTTNQREAPPLTVLVEAVKGAPQPRLAQQPRLLGRPTTNTASYCVAVGGQKLWRSPVSCDHGDPIAGRVRVEIMGAPVCRIVRKSQSVRIES
jgi:hypothetical protein